LIHIILSIVHVLLCMCIVSIAAGTIFLTFLACIGEPLSLPISPSRARRQAAEVRREQLAQKALTEVDWDAFGDYIWSWLHTGAKADLEADERIGAIQRKNAYDLVERFQSKNEGWGRLHYGVKHSRTFAQRVEEERERHDSQLASTGLTLSRIADIAKSLGPSVNRPDADRRLDFVGMLPTDDVVFDIFAPNNYMERSLLVDLAQMALEKSNMIIGMVYYVGNAFPIAYYLGDGSWLTLETLRILGIAHPRQSSMR
jgi:hypothetical protein